MLLAGRLDTENEAGRAALLPRRNPPSRARNGTEEYTKPEPFENQIHDKASKDLVQQQDVKRELEKLREQLNNSSQDGNDLIRYEFIADGVRITAIDSSSKPSSSPARPSSPSTASGC